MDGNACGSSDGVSANSRLIAGNHHGRSPVRRRYDGPEPELLQHLDPTSGCNRILSLDSGGLRGVVTLTFLARIEKVRASSAEKRLLYLTKQAAKKSGFKVA